MVKSEIVLGYKLEKTAHIQFILVLYFLFIFFPLVCIQNCYKNLRYITRQYVSTFKHNAFSLTLSFYEVFLIIGFKN